MQKISSGRWKLTLKQNNGDVKYIKLQEYMKQKLIRLCYLDVKARSKGLSKQHIAPSEVTTELSFNTCTRHKGYRKTHSKCPTGSRKKRAEHRENMTSDTTLT